MVDEPNGELEDLLALRRVEAELGVRANFIRRALKVLRWRLVTAAEAVRVAVAVVADLEQLCRQLIERIGDVGLVRVGGPGVVDVAVHDEQIKLVRELSGVGRAHCRPVREAVAAQLLRSKRLAEPVDVSGEQVRAHVVEEVGRLPGPLPRELNFPVFILYTSAHGRVRESEFIPNLLLVFLRVQVPVLWRVNSLLHLCLITPASILRVLGPRVGVRQVLVVSRLVHGEFLVGIEQKGVLIYVPVSVESAVVDLLMEPIIIFADATLSNANRVVPPAVVFIRRARVVVA
mmetsp:Transcript_28443/g.83725  ORF Transcript_28443/g.83725 Transcript_28443/m.83725 type:complete len:289 (-) Transcript_28443:594-1460(-)